MYSPHSALQLLRSCLGTSRCRPAWRALLALLLLAVGILALMPAPPRGLDTGWDKANHLLAFAALMLAAFFASASARGRWLIAPPALLAYGGLIELAQAQLPPRQADWADLLADGLGLCIGLILAAVLRRLADGAAPDTDS